MNKKYFIFTIIGMLLFQFSLPAEVTAIIKGKDLHASTNSKAMPGLKGCHGIPREVTAYVFHLYKKTLKKDICTIEGKKKWIIFSTLPSNNNKVSFQNLDEGNYKVECLVAQPIGCVIDEEKAIRSVIYKKEASQTIGLEEPEPDAPWEAERITENNPAILTLFPNPTDEILTIYLKDHPFKGQLHLQIINLMGKPVYQNKEYISSPSLKDEYCIELTTASIPGGTYILQVMDNEGNNLSAQLLIIHQRGKVYTSPNQPTKN